MHRKDGTEGHNKNLISETLMRYLHIIISHYCQHLSIVRPREQPRLRLPNHVYCTQRVRYLFTLFTVFLIRLHKTQSVCHNPSNCVTMNKSTVALRWRCYKYPAYLFKVYKSIFPPQTRALLYCSRIKPTAGKTRSYKEFYGNTSEQIINWTFPRENARKTTYFTPARRNAYIKRYVYCPPLC